MPSRDHHAAPSRRGGRSLAVAVAAAALLSGCITGERPTLIDRPEVDDPAVRAVLDRLATASSGDFTATYEITPTSTGTSTEATVVQAGGRRRITIGAVDYLTDGTVNRTCTNDERGCVDFLDDARISDLNITHRFWGDAFLARLELDASRRVGFSEAGNETIAGQPAACVDIPVPSSSELAGTVQYCALDAGPLARYIGADVTIELVGFEPTADPTSFDS